MVDVPKIELYDLWDLENMNVMITGDIITITPRTEKNGFRGKTIIYHYSLLDRIRGIKKEDKVKQCIDKTVKKLEGWNDDIKLTRKANNHFR